MKVAIMQPYFFPYIGYWQLLNFVDIFVIFDDVNYIKKGWINRNNILVNGEPWLFTLPLQKASPNKKINEIYLDENNKWKESFLKTLERSYKNAPYYDQTENMVNKIIYNKKLKLVDYLKNTIELLSEHIGIKTRCIYSSKLKIEEQLKGQDKIIEIALLLGTTRYINPIGGQDLYSREKFKENNIQLSFLKTNVIEYQQFNNEFIPNLSIIDVLMFNSKEKISSMLKELSLI